MTIEVVKNCVKYGEESKGGDKRSKSSYLKETGKGEILYLSTFVTKGKLAYQSLGEVVVSVFAFISCGKCKSTSGRLFCCPNAESSVILVP